MNASVLKFALGFGGALAVAGCSSALETGSEADTVAQQLAQCLDGKPFFFAADVAAPQRRTRIGRLRAETPVLSSGGGEAGQIEAAIDLTYAVDAAGARVLAARGLCAPGVRCFPAHATAELFPRERGGYDFDLSLVDTFGPYRGGWLLALAPADLHGAGDGGCPK